MNYRYNEEEIKFDYKGVGYSVIVNIDSEEEWDIVSVTQWGKYGVEFWVINNLEIRKGLTKKLDEVIAEYAKELDYPFESDYDWKDLQYDQETP
tara:strand:+ start:48 stop:329 length:282 start_codon:yes stop_codon:yes gene_type:complete